MVGVGPAEDGVLPGGVGGLPRHQAAGQHPEVFVQQELGVDVGHAVLESIAKHPVAGVAVGVPLGKGLNVIAAVVGTDAGQLGGGQGDADLRVGLVEHRPLRIQHREGVVRPFQAAGQGVVVPGGQMLVGEEAVPVKGGEEPVELVVPQQIDPRRNEQQGEGEEKIVSDQQAEEAAVPVWFSLQFYTPVHVW